MGQSMGCAGRGEKVQGAAMTMAEGSRGGRRTRREQGHPVGLEVGEALLEEGRLRAEAREGEHGEARVGDLGLEHALVGQLERVEGEVARGAAGAVGSLVDGDGPDGLEEEDRDEHEAHVAVGDHCVVRRERGEPFVGGAREVEAQVDGDPADDGEHADAAVLELGLAHPVDHREGAARPAHRLFRDDRLGHVPVQLREPDRVEAFVSGVRPVKGGGLLQEGNRLGHCAARSRGADPGRGLEGTGTREAQSESNLLHHRARLSY
mmetsp:Transcript_23284/g.72923  ORF Transcript_23284/g.72923 Transcript_23284/m.72923 type:complete len:264 (-) Transcript_23284:12-803(-)|eukprot:CAMPEP_0197394156 /NCGR_PEP_ID=MMETSP1165-20131217/4721_1 /TAXON_ID=284809 /ORGANISM="Chrysocystis fragilis, Strain CCMP3189" /LENGTH=263 /DNA_ID=CAMNT_0042919843 /DNA_START=432 /DNA_END=1223 /DNA_ORIENTATION=+